VVTDLDLDAEDDSARQARIGTALLTGTVTLAVDELALLLGLATGAPTDLATPGSDAERLAADLWRLLLAVDTDLAEQIRQLTLEHAAGLTTVTLAQLFTNHASQENPR
jgi:hypothetical protein